MIGGEPVKKILCYQTRFPDELRGETPFILGRHKDTFIILFDGDVDGFQPMPRPDAEHTVQDYVSVPISTFLEIASWTDAINKI